MVEPSSFGCFATRPGLCGFRSRRPSSRPPTYGAAGSPLPSFPLGATTSLANVIEQFSEGGGLVRRTAVRLEIFAVEEPVLTRHAPGHRRIRRFVHHLDEDAHLIHGRPRSPPRLLFQTLPPCGHPRSLLHRHVGPEQPTFGRGSNLPDLAAVLGAVNECLCSLDRGHSPGTSELVVARRLDHNRSPGESLRWASRAPSARVLAP
jgi:hypothetical protein